MTQMMFYERPVALNRERHRSLRLAPAANHYAFAAGTNAVPIASSEFAEAARDYPIVFVGQDGGPFNVAALVGLRDRQNLMVDAQGQWAAATLPSIWFPWMPQVQGAASAAPVRYLRDLAQVLDHGLAPLHRRATANARRLGRTPLK